MGSYDIRDIREILEKMRERKQLAKESPMTPPSVLSREQVETLLLIFAGPSRSASRSAKAQLIDVYAQQAQEIAWQTNAHNACRDEIALVSSKLTVLTAERDAIKATAGDTEFSLRQQLAASQARVRELEKALEAHGRNPTLWLEQYNRAEQLQARLTTSEQETGRLKAALSGCVASLSVYVNGGNPSSPYKAGANPFYILGSREALDQAQRALNGV